MGKPTTPRCATCARFKPVGAGKTGQCAVVEEVTGAAGPPIKVRATARCELHLPIVRPDAFKLAETDPRPFTGFEHSLSFYRGFRDGSGAGAIDSTLKDFEAYKLGYRQGREASSRARHAFNRRVGYVPSILRTQGDETGKPACSNCQHWRHDPRFGPKGMCHHPSAPPEQMCPDACCSNHTPVPAKRDASGCNHYHEVPSYVCPCRKDCVCREEGPCVGMPGPPARSA